MFAIVQGTTRNVRLNVNNSLGYFLIVFTNTYNNDVVYGVFANIGSILKPIITVIDTGDYGTPNPLEGEVNLNIIGNWSARIYKQSSSSNLNIDNALFIIETNVFVQGDSRCVVSSRNTPTIKTCQDVKDCLGISLDGSDTKFLNEKGEFAEVSGGGSGGGAAVGPSGAVQRTDGSGNFVGDSCYIYNPSLDSIQIGKGSSASGYNSVVSGGFLNTASAYASTVSGGYNNRACSFYSTVAGGGNNLACVDNTTVSGGQCNTASASYSTVSGGNTNRASGVSSVVSGGEKNNACGFYTSVLGGLCNTASAYYSTISGGFSNLAEGCASVVSGGKCNTSNGCYSTISGGYKNTVYDRYTFIGGGLYNFVQNVALCGATGAVAHGIGANSSGGTWDSSSGCFTVAPTPIDAGCSSTIGGGFQNSASAIYSTISGGRGNIVTSSAYYSVIAGGDYNFASSNYSTVSGGGGNTASGNYSTISGGVENCATEYSVISGGCKNNALDRLGYIGGGICNFIRNTTACGATGAVVHGIGSNTSGGIWNPILAKFTNNPTSCTNAGCSSTISGGFQNRACANYATVSGGYCNIANALFSSVVGGCKNTIATTYCHSFIIGSGITSDRACSTFVNNLSIKNIPTSSAGLPAGSVWSNLGILTIV